MNFKPDFFKSRTFWTGIASTGIWVAAGSMDSESAMMVQGIVQNAMPLVLLGLGITERKNAASVKK